MGRVAGQFWAALCVCQGARGSLTPPVPAHGPGGCAGLWVQALLGCGSGATPTRSATAQRVHPLGAQLAQRLAKGHPKGAYLQSRNEPRRALPYGGAIF